jgi:hypothetical protein
MLKDEQWPIARLIPISSASGVEAQERRAASALLAVLTAVEEFGRALLRPLRAPIGKVEAFIEVPFELDGRTIRPDGVLAVSRGSRGWRALVEVKTGASPLEVKQIESYLDVARQYEFDALISISNHYVTSSSDYPISLPKNRSRKVALHHWSWIDVLTEAILQKQYRGVKDPDQAYILGELIRYLRDPRSGAVSFEGMGSGWTAVRDGIRDGTLRRQYPSVEAVALRWDDLVRYLCLDLTQELGRDVRPLLGKDEREPATRLRRLKEALVDEGKLTAQLHIPDVAAPLALVADLRTRRITASTVIDAPREGRSRGRVSWLLRQIPEAPEYLLVEARVPYVSSPPAGTLGSVRADPARLYPDRGREIRQFRLSLSRDMGLKRDAGRGSFVESVQQAIKLFYGGVLQNVSAWKARPPRLPRQLEEQEPVTDEIEDQHAELVQPIEEARREQAEEAASPGSFSSGS